MKEDLYGALVSERKACRACADDLCNPSAWPDLDSGEIGPWSRWQGTLDAELMVVGQDWGDVGFFKRNHGVEVNVPNPTNEALRKLLASVGIEIPPPCDDPRRGPVFFTNAILCLKQGGLHSSVKGSWFRNCAPFLRRTIEIVRPKVVVALGERAYRAICRAFNVRPVAKFGDAVKSPVPTTVLDGIHVVAVYHCGALGQIARSLAAQLDDWKRVRRLLKPDVD